MFSRSLRTVTKRTSSILFTPVSQNISSVSTTQSYSWNFNLFYNSKFYSTQQQQQQQQQGESQTETQVNKWNPSQLKVVIVGAQGDLGNLLVKRFQPHVKSILAITSGSEFSPNQNKSRVSATNVEYRKIDITNKFNDFDFLEGVDIVINASGTWIERDHTFKEIFVDGTKNLAFHSRRVGVKRFIQLGALGSFNDSRSAWLNYKYRAEDMAYAAFPDATIVRPGIMFGEHATPFNHIVNRLALSPIVPAPYSLVNVQPVWEQDVVEAITRLALYEEESKVHDTIWDLGGPHYYPVKDLIKVSLQSAGKSRAVVSLYPFTSFIWDFILGITQLFPGAKIPRDYLTMMIHDWNRTQNDGWVVTGHLVEETDRHNTFKDLQIEPKSLEEVLPQYFGSKHVSTTIEKAATH